MAISHSLAELFGDRCRTDADSLLQYGQDWTRYTTPAPSAVVFPQSVGELQELVRLANRERVALVPSGGRTGLSGGACATAGEVVVSLERMNRVLEIDTTDRLVRCEAGVVTETLQDTARQHGLYFPVDFASRGSSRIGGNVSTNAGGIKVVRYGMFREWVAGLTVVTGTGEVLELNHGLAKNNAGYDLRQLFIGAEGTLGFVADATLKLARQPGELQVMLFAVPVLAGVMQVFNRFRRVLDLSAFEFFDHKALGHVAARGHVASPFEHASAYYVVLEFERLSDATEAAALAAFEELLEDGAVTDGVLSQSEAQAKQLWRLREDISESITPRTPYKNDIAVRPSQVPAFVAELDALLAREYPDFEVVWFGHIGDGNLHINVLCPTDWQIDAFRRACERVNVLLFDLLRRYRGSVSAEHGIGLLKRDYLDVTRSAAEIDLMRQLKAVFDPNGIMNPGKLFLPQPA